MRFVSSALENPIVIEPGKPFSLHVENATLFARICDSVLSGEGDGAVEPYSLWSDEGEKLNPAGSAITIGNVFDLPWDDRRLTGNLFDKIDELYREDEGKRAEIERLAGRLEAAIARLTFQVGADYRFGIEWNLRQQLKAFSFQIDRPAACSLLDSLMRFFDCCADLASEKLLVFVNLEKFLAPDELKELQSKVFFHKLLVLTIEKGESRDKDLPECNKLIDLHFLES